jgi:hypothetical protein
MIDNNLPPGCKLSDIPGWNEYETDVKFECDNEDCYHEWEEEVTVDPSISGGHDVEGTCPECKTVYVKHWEPYDPRDDYDDNDRYGDYEYPY